MTFQEFLARGPELGSTEVRMVVYPQAVWRETEEEGIYVYCHFMNVNSPSVDLFIIGNEVRDISGNVAASIYYRTKDGYEAREK